MNIIIEQQYFASLIVKERLKTITAEEEEVLAAWLAANEKNRLLYGKLKRKDYTNEIKKLRGIDTEVGYRRYKQRYDKAYRSSLYRYSLVAAVITIFITTGIFLFRQPDVKTEQADIRPGSAKAVLVLNDGSVRELATAGCEEMIEVGKMIVCHTGSRIEYPLKGTDTLNEAAMEIYNELIIPTGGEYQLTMSDGTKVWLNSQTQLRFPVNFTGKQRVVYLEGEAYFDVARDEERPFLIKLKNDVNVEVLGTSFNVRAYEDEYSVETVLEHGAVRMWHDTKEVVLKPGIRAVYDQQEDTMSSMQVDTELYSSWRNGHFVFQEETVENILHQLSRWYGMNIFFSDEKAKEIRFSGNVRKYETIRNLLDAMEASGGIHFEIKGNTVVVSSRY